ncbi:Uncharacterised protein at_DN2014 [Pycnogonum litorale]
MSSVMKEQVIKLDDESLHTLFCEVEQIVNNRPITAMNEDIDDPEPLTPNHLLLLQGNGTPAPGIFTKSDNTARRRWRQVQYLANIFWSRWVKEYLPTLQERRKWFKPQRNICIGDIVLIADDKVSKNCWSMGRVTNVYKDDKDIVRMA